MSIKDPFLQLVDEITLIRQDMERLKRTNLDKEEAKALNHAVMGSVLRIIKVTEEAPGKIQGALEADRDQMARSATHAATKSAESALSGIRHDLDNERAKLSQAAGEARRQAWRYFGGFLWVWLVSMLAIGAALGVLLTYGTETAKSAFSVEQMVRYSCGSRWFGGQVVEQNDESRFCAFWMEPKPQAEN
ncbi:hypothetical protein [Paracoccus marcusii]|uniref:hypothetical protein n=1 Tax=Paracoccus marcusii TaxID=59779 RepID=UPI002493B169|nr:hypothetical protein [Paracoccus marcusii]